MYQIKIENEYGDMLELTHNPNYIVTATGLSPVKSNVITKQVANYGGSKYQSSKAESRNIVLTIYVNHPVESNRLNLYKYVKSGRPIRVYYKNRTRNVYIDGYVEAPECDLFSRTQTLQVSIICPQPNFIDVDKVNIGNSEYLDNFNFKFKTEVLSGEGQQLEIAGFNSGVVRFTDFLATPTTAIENGEIVGLGVASNNKYDTELVFTSGAYSKTVTIPLGIQVEGQNLIRGGKSLIDEANILIGAILTDELDNILIDEMSNVLTE